MADSNDLSPGLGLPIVRKIVEFHGGRAGVRSAPGSGSIFSWNCRSNRSREGREHPERVLPDGCLRAMAPAYLELRMRS